jgi:hypothetical protein
VTNTIATLCKKTSSILRKNAAYAWHSDQRKRRDHCRQHKLQDKDDKIDRTWGSVMTRHTQRRNNTRRRIIMALGNGMLAQALLDYFDQHTEEFETFLLDRAAIADGYVLWKGDTSNKRLLLTFTIFGWDGCKRSARDYALKIETL